MFTNEIAELPSLNGERPLLPPRIEHFVVGPLTKAERAARRSKVVRTATFAFAIAVVVLVTALPATGTTP
jgi:hypothetical protein